mmetsp:Transcript_28297/g.76192  ORF Transcript_28297/g.76192 Transcript_28297/m.76192 type:complete len:564 (-) Transcript_28297:302-1993(-)
MGSCASKPDQTLIPPSTQRSSSFDPSKIPAFTRAESGSPSETAHTLRAATQAGQRYEWRSIPHLVAADVFGSLFRVDRDLRRASVLKTRSTISMGKPPTQPVGLESPAALLAQIGGSRGTIGPLISEEAADAHFAMSHPAPVSIDLFVSHCWESAAWPKAFALAFFHHHRRAVLAANVTFVLAFASALAGRTDKSGEAGQGWSGLGVVLLGGPLLAYLSVVLLGAHLFSDLSRQLFVDKACVHQTDPYLYRKGVDSIKDVLRSSSALAVLEAPEYWHRHWCIFELGTYVHAMGGARGLKMLPLYSAPLLVGLWAMVGLRQMVNSIFNANAVQPHGADSGVTPLTVMALNLAMIACEGLPAALLVHLRESQREYILNQLSTFDISATLVTVEKDRLMVDMEIVSLFGSVEAFEQHVRTSVHAAVERALGPSARLRFGWALFVCLPCVWGAGMNTLAAGRQVREFYFGCDTMLGWTLANLMTALGKMFITMPLGLNVASSVSSRLRDMPFAAGTAFTLFTFVCTVSLLEAMTGLVLSLPFTAAFCGGDTVLDMASASLIHLSDSL